MDVLEAITPHPVPLAQYLDLWREHSRSRDESGEIPLTELPNVVFSECNPTRELLDALADVKADGIQVSFLHVKDVVYKP